jgi:NADH-quinone oxidoreductase subunit L
MFRMLFLTFNNGFRGTHEQEHHLHESPKSMTIPLIVLAILSVFGGLLGVPEVLGGEHWLSKFLYPVFYSSSSRMVQHPIEHSTEYLLMGVSVAAALIAAAIAFVKYSKNGHVPQADGTDRGFITNLSYNKYYIDEIYDAIITKPLNALSNILYRFVDKSGIDGIVNGLGQATTEASKGMRLLQSGNIGFYIFMMVAGVIALLLYGFYNI